MKHIGIICAILLAMTACSTAEKDKMAAKKDKVESDAKAGMKKAEAKAESSMKASGELSANCTLDKDTRVIEVRKTESGGCELFYTKFGEEKSVASSGFGTQYCEEV